MEVLYVSGKIMKITMEISFLSGKNYEIMGSASSKIMLIIMEIRAAVSCERGNSANSSEHQHIKLLSCYMI
jgi:hypothetical protein